MNHKLFPIPKETDRFIRATIKEMARHPLIGYRWDTDDIKISYRTNARGLANITINHREKRIISIIFDRGFILSQSPPVLRYNITHELNHIPVKEHGTAFELNMFKITGLYVPDGFTCNHPSFNRQNFWRVCGVLESV